MKEIDNGSKSLGDWKRGMLGTTIERRFGIPIAELEKGVNIAGMPVCPECQGSTFPVKIILADKNVMFYPQCAANQDKNHGFGKFSIHGTRAPMGRKMGSKNVAHVEPVAVPEPVRKPVAAPQLPSGKVFHERFADVLRLYMAGERAFMLKGPAGSGKTTIASDLAESLSVPFFVHQGSANSEEADLTRWRNPHTGEMKVSPGMQAAIAGPCVYLIDEGDSILPGVLLCLNMPLANRKIEIDGKTHDIHPDAVFVLAGNAVNGGSRQYTGRYPIDAATRDRFFEVFCDYSPAIDKLICPVEEIRNRVSDIRRRVNNDPNLSKAFMPGARFLKRCMTTWKAYNLDAERAIRKTLELSMDPDTMSQIMG